MIRDRLYTPLSCGTNPAAKAAAVEGPPIAAFDAVKTSSQLDCTHFPCLASNTPMQFPIKVPPSTIMECTNNVRDANANAMGPPETADEMSAVVPTAAKSR